MFMAEENTDTKQEEQGAQMEQGKAEGASPKKSFGETLKSYFDKGVAASVKGLKSAGSAISDFGDVAVIRLDNAQLNSKLEKHYQSLGELAAKELLDGSGELSKKTEGISALLNEIAEIRKKISKNDDAIDAINKKSKQDAPSGDEGKSAE